MAQFQRIQNPILISSVHSIVITMTSIFLSYARDDDETFVRRLHADLTKARFDVWFDRVSMPSRQLTFHQEIRDAIAARDRLLLVVGSGVQSSDYVTQEWRFAYFEAGKCVNPIVRLDGRGVDGGVIDGYNLIPEDLRLLHAEDFRDDAHYDAHLANLIRQLSGAIPPVGKLVAVPELPACFLAQPDRLKALRDLLLVDLQKPVVVSGVAARVGLQGMGGIGKSVLASALAHRPEVRRAFPDGIFWITLGQKPQLAELQRWLARESGDEALFPDERSGKECLRNLLAGRKALLVLDDVWQREDAEAFNVVGAMGRILLTTRDAGLVTALASKETHYRVELPTEAEAEGIFAAAAQSKPGAPAIAISHAEMREVVEQCGRLPLALALCGGMVQKGVAPQTVLEALRKHALASISDRWAAEDQHRNIWVAMAVSLEVLSADERARFIELAVFPLDRGAPQVAVDTLWQHTGGLEPFECQILLAELAERSLVQLTPAPEGEGGGMRMTLHDLLHNFATGMAEKLHGSLAALHQTLLDAYKKMCPAGWPSGPDDGYYFQNHCAHLLAAGKLDDTVALLTDLLWIEAKCKAKLVFSLQDDYRNTFEAMPEAQEGMRQEHEWQARLTRWADDITAYSRQWSERRDRFARGESLNEPEPQLPEAPVLCQMWTEEQVEAECHKTRKTSARLSMLAASAQFVRSECYTFLQVGEREGFVLQHAFNYAPDGPIHDAAGSLIAERTAPMLLRRWPKDAVWNPKPAVLRTLRDPRAKPWQSEELDMTPDGRRAISVGERDHKMRLWDLETGVCLRVFDGFIGPVSITANGRIAVSGHVNGTLQVLDLESGICVRAVKECTSSFCITPDGRRAITTRGDKRLRVWDLDTGVCLLVLEGHTDGVNSVSMTPDGRHAISSGRDGALRVWNLESGTSRNILNDAPYRFMSVVLTPDGRRAISAGFDHVIRVWDPESGACVRKMEGHEGFVSCLSVTPNGRCVVSGGSDRTMRVWDVETGMCLRVLRGHTHLVGGVRVTPDRRRAVSAGNALRVWNIEDGHEQPLELHLGAVTCVELTPDGRKAISGGVDKVLRVWDTQSAACLYTLDGHGQGIDSVSVTVNGRLAASNPSDSSVRIWDLETGLCINELEPSKDPKGWFRNACVAPEGHGVELGDIKTLLRRNQGGDSIRTLRDRGPINWLEVTPDGRRAVSGLGDFLRVWDIESGACLHTLQGYSGFGILRVTADGQFVVSGGDNNTLRVWNLENGVCLRTLEGHRGHVHSLSLSPDGGTAASVCDFEGALEPAIWIWDIVDGICLRTLQGHLGGVTTVNVAPDGRHVISGSGDETVRVWDMLSGACLQVLAAGMFVSSAEICRDLLVFGTDIGNVVFTEIRNILSDPPAAPIHVDTSDAEYGALLQRGLELSIREKGPDHEETIAHRKALAVHLERFGGQTKQ